MPKELRVSIAAELPDGLFEEAARITELRPLFENLRAEFPGATIEVDVVVPRSRAAKDGEPTP